MLVGKINNTDRYNYVTFKGPKEDFGKCVNDVFKKTYSNRTITEESKQGLIISLKNAIRDIISSTNLLGKGFSNAVYKIDDNFVLKICKRLVATKDFEDIPNKIDFTTSNLSKLKTYYGGELFRVGENISIMKNAGNHIPAGIPYERTNGLDNAWERHKYYMEDYLPRFAKIPQESFDDIAIDFAELNKLRTQGGKYYEFDSVNPGNIILVKDKLLMVDEMNEVSQSSMNTIGKLVEMLLYKYNIHKVVQSYENHVVDAREILKKIIIAGEKANLPYVTREIDEQVFNQIVRTCSINKTSEEFLDDLFEIRMDYPKFEERLSILNKYIDGNFIILNPINR